MTPNTQSKEEAGTAGYAAVTILAYLDMGNEEEAGHLLRTLDRRTLGLVVTTWYQLCVAARTAEVAAATAFKTAAFLKRLNDETTEPASTADNFGGTLLEHLAANKMDKYAKAWQTVVNHDPDISTEVAARVLGFARGFLGKIPAKEDN